MRIITKNSRSKQIKKKLIEFASQSSSHGLPKIFTTKKLYLKIMWFILFVLFSVLGVYKVIEMSVKYLEYEVVTRIDLVQEIPTEFPSVSFYSLKNPSANYSIKDLLIVCLYNQKFCDESDFDTIRDKHGYVLYKFKGGRTYFSGKAYGLYMSLYNFNSTPGKMSVQDGLRIVVHNRTSDPGFYGGFISQGVDVPSGFFTSISINRIFSSKLGVPYNKCIKNATSYNLYDSELYRYILKYTNYSYAQKDCFDYCIGREFYRYLNITNKIENFVNLWFTLENHTQHKLSNTYSRLVKGKILDLCSTECPLECDSIKYDLSISFSKMILDNLREISQYGKYTKLAELLESNSSLINDQNNFVGINVFYNDLSYTYISQMPKMELSEYISNIGGILGLFIGISFLSLVEFLELFIELFLIVFKKKKKNNSLV